MGSQCFGFIFLLRLEKDCCSLQSCLESCESLSASVTQYLTVDKTKLDGELMELKVSKKGSCLTFVQEYGIYKNKIFAFSSTFTLSYSHWSQYMRGY